MVIAFDTNFVITADTIKPKDLILQLSSASMSEGMISWFAFNGGNHCTIARKISTKRTAASCLSTHLTVQWATRVLQLKKITAVTLRSAVMRLGPERRNAMHS